ncbi:hypothetical protein WP50_20145 [Lactiplantibacillus plantarum]|nr:hypothetical protein WP50_20145 [Lactiplantibacillus plantarum]
MSFIHVPLSDEAQAEARLLMLAAHHILAPKDGKPVVTPSQDMVIGNYYLTTEEIGREGEGMIFKDLNEAQKAYQSGYVHLHSRVGIQVSSMPDKPFTRPECRPGYANVHNLIGKPFELHSRPTFR